MTVLANCGLAIPWMENSISVSKNHILAPCFQYPKSFFVLLLIIGKFLDTDIIEQGKISFILLDSGNCTYQTMIDLKIEQFLCKYLLSIHSPTPLFGPKFASQNILWLVIVFKIIPCWIFHCKC